MAWSLIQDGGGGTPADQHQVLVLGDFVHPQENDLLDYRIFRNELEIVENESRPGFQTAEGLLEKTPGKGGDALEIFRGQKGQGFFSLGKGID